MRQDDNPNAWADLASSGNLELDSIESLLKEPVAFRTTIPAAKANIMELRDAFRSIPYIWSYFRIIDVLNKQLESFIETLQETPVIAEKKSTPHPESALSQVKTKKETVEKTADADLDNPFVSLEEFGASTTTAPSDDDFLGDLDTSGVFGDLDLMSDLEAATEFDKLKEAITEEERAQIVSDEVDDDDGFLPVIATFDNLALKGFGERIGKIPVIIERLLHHAKREGRMTRIMQDYLQDIFREASVDWRITGLLAEDFVQSEPSKLASRMIGIASPFVIIQESFDLEYWTREALQTGDERLMYSLSLLPSEEVHRSIREGKLAELNNEIGNLLVTTKTIKPPKLSLEMLKKTPAESNIWGFRLMIQDVNKDYKAATILCENPEISWEEDFKQKLQLPGVLEDWNVEYTARFEDFSDTDSYKIVLGGARDVEDAFIGFTRWLRRHSILYRNQYGVKGTVNHLKSILEETEDKQQGQLIFDLLTKLTEYGISEAVDVLSDEAIVRKLPWLYS
ncbi:MAG: hypothetical protein IH840_03135 [Candidatus Heimdallarchaeota archaeon]|nr:hypothetical protein [Candidatus Heimdallarchaeota archaeon]